MSARTTWSMTRPRRVVTDDDRGSWLTGTSDVLHLLADLVGHRARMMDSSGLAVSLVAHSRPEHEHRGPRHRGDGIIDAADGARWISTAGLMVRAL